MKEFGAVDAWALGLRFFSGRAAVHLAILAGIGVLAPYALQFLVLGQAAGLLNPAAMSEAASNSSTATGIAAVGAGLVGYVLQAGSYFASWRLGFGRDETPGGALGFGMLAALLVLVAIILAVGVLGYGLGQVTPLLGIAVGGIAMMLIVAVLWTTVAALMAAAIILVFGVTMIVGFATGNFGFAATLVGGSGFVVVLLIILAGIMLWRAARFSCTTALLAERRSFDLFAAMAESWRLTWEDEWRITRYLALLGFALAIALLGIALLAGAGLAARMAAEPGLGIGIGAVVVQMILTVAVAYLAVLVPAGIYRELAGSPAPVEVFA